MPTKKTTSTAKQHTFGTCAYSKTNPDQTRLTGQTKVLNIHLSFEEALKLNIAVDE
jgi:hypothetical protein